MSELQQLADVVKMASGSPFPPASLTDAVCHRCEQTFQHEPVARWGGALIRRDLCDDCAEECEAEEAERCAAEDRRRQYEMRVSCGGYRDDDRGSRLARASLDAFIEGEHNSRAAAKAREWIAEVCKPNLLIVGPIGSGKSYLAACLYNALHDGYELAYWLNAGSLMALIRRGFNGKDAAADAGARMELAERTPYLVLDDLGKVHPGKDVSWVEETFYSIVEARYRNELPTIVTTEWKSAALAERVGQSVVSRLEDGAWVAGIKKPASPYRRPQ